MSLQQKISFPWEILLIDNNSTDDTAAIARETWKESNGSCNLRIIKEMRPGTMFARHTGILSANYRYLLFCDDDNWFNPMFVKNAFESIHRDSSIAAVGGHGILEFEPRFQPPPWIESFKKSLGAGPQGREDGDTTYVKGCLYTAGAILDRVWLDRLYSSGFKSSLKGRDGKSLVAGEDTELTYALKLISGKLHYNSKMHFKHFMPSGRITWPYLKKMWQSFGYSDFLISPYKMHFKKRKPYTFIVVILERVITLIRFFFLAAFGSFAEGDRNVLQFQRSIGQLKAAVFNYKTFLANQRMVAKLLHHNKAAEVEKI